jgi:hypothetical protein
MSAQGEGFEPQAISRRSWFWLAAIIAVGLVAYIGVVSVYNSEGGYTTSVDDAGMTGVSPAAYVVVAPSSFDSAVEVGGLHLNFEIDATTSPLIGADDKLTENLRFIIDGVGDQQEIRFVKGSELAEKDIVVDTSGAQWKYPFDVHSGYFEIRAETYEKSPDGNVVTLQLLPLDVVPADPTSSDGGVTGWDTALEAKTSASSTFFEVTYTRGFSTKVFSLLLLVLASILATATATVAFLVAAGRRKAEIGLMSWTAALLFALPALRSFMPNSPPIGAGIDMYVYLWVMLAAIVAAITMIIAWVKQSGWALFGRRHAVDRLRHDTSGDD